jgi:YedE family putative selenium metabolism protein
MVGGIRDIVLFKEFKLILGFVAIFASTLVFNLILTGVTDGTYFTLGFADQPIAHTDGLWNALGMYLTGFACVLLGGCPLRQLVLAGEGNTDSAVTVLGLMVGAAFAHNFGLASSANGPTTNGQIAVVIGIVVVALIACMNTFGKKE